MMPSATVDMSHAFEPARTNGRTAMRSIATPHTAHSASAISTDGSIGHPSLTLKVKHSTAPSIIEVPCAKLTVLDTA